MDFHLLLSFIGASILLILMPGPDNIFVLTESLTKGYRTGIAISTGLSSGIFIHTLVATTGLALLLQQSPLAFTIIKLLGALYLFYLAYQAFIDKQQSLISNNHHKNENINYFQLMRKGLLMNVLNPKVSLFFIAFLPQFISKDGIKISLQMIILGTIFMILALFFFSLIAIVSGRLTSTLNNPKFWNVTRWIKTGILLLLGLTLLLSKH